MRMLKDAKFYQSGKFSILNTGLHTCNKNICLPGQKYKIYCDSKAPVNLLSGTTSKLPLQIERMVLLLQGYNYDIEYVKNKNNISYFISEHLNKQQTNQKNKILD